MSYGWIESARLGPATVRRAPGSRGHRSYGWIEAAMDDDVEANDVVCIVGKTPQIQHWEQESKRKILD
uniref:Uncharacterized protein n=1 Tax=Arundo donax TaxID=35708 RepID=A0A0A8Z0W1_ARUDO